MEIKLKKGFGDAGLREEANQVQDFSSVVCYVVNPERFKAQNRTDLPRFPSKSMTYLWSAEILTAMQTLDLFFPFSFRLIFQI